jgi:hypothetical protein
MVSVTFCMTTKVNFVRLRRLLDRSLADNSMKPVSDPEWNVIQAQGYARDFATGDPEAISAALDFVLNVLRPVQVNRVSPTSRKSTQRQQKGADVTAYHEALSVALVADALRDETCGREIRAFRHQVLKDALISEEQVEQWVVEQARRDGQASEIEIPVAENDVDLRLDTLTYGVKVIRHVPVRWGAALDRLKRLSERLAVEYGWHPAKATTFILTGQTPAVPSILITVSEHRERPARSRITLEVHPTSTPREVAATFASMRKSYFGRLRRLSAKHSRLATIYAQHPDETPEARLKRWNRWCERNDQSKGKRDWRYSESRSQQLTRDARRAWQRLGVRI